MLYRRGVLQQLITEYSGWVNIQLQDIIKKIKVMKANEAPENVYLALNVFGDIIKEHWQFHRLCDDDIEYTRTDAFIKKAERYIRSVADGLDRDDDVDTFINEFKRYMKEE